MLLGEQIIWLFMLSIPIACVAWTVTHEQIFAEPRDYCKRRSEAATHILIRKFFYLFTCEYCFSFYVTGFFMVLTGYHMLLPDWRGILIGWFSLMWIANVYMSLFLFIRTDIKKEGMESKIKEREVNQAKN